VLPTAEPTPRWGMSGKYPPAYPLMGSLRWKAGGGHPGFDAPLLQPWRITSPALVCPGNICCTTRPGGAVLRAGNIHKLKRDVVGEKIHSAKLTGCCGVSRTCYLEFNDLSRQIPARGLRAPPRKSNPDLIGTRPPNGGNCSGF